MDIGYKRVSSVDQNPARQLEGVPLNKVFLDKRSGASTTNREAWKQCFEYLREGDTLHVHSMDRLARNLLDLRHIVESLISMDVIVKFHSENLVFENGETNPMANLLLNVLGAVAEFERSLIRERQREGIVLAKKKGVKWGRRCSLGKEQRQAAQNMVEDGFSVTKVAKEFKVSRQTIYRVLKQEEAHAKGSTDR